jgi:uncharacterized delta-60 repeat protein
MATSTALGYNSPFSIGTGFNANVNSISIQSDGKILVGGAFTTFIGSSQNSLIRLNFNGSKDTTFNIGTGFGGSIGTTSIQSDGKIVAGGFFNTFTGSSQSRLIRLNSDGSKDTTFDIGTGFNGGIEASAIQSDGKIIVGGFFTTFTGSSQNYLIRLNSNGSKDTTFDIGTGFGSGVNSIAIQSDGKILVGGAFTTFTGSTQNNLIRLNSDGSKDTTFDIGTGFNGTVYSIPIQSDGKIVAGGQYSTFAGNSQNYLVRLNSNGSKDSTFDIGTGFNGTVYSTSIQSDGKIVAGGNFFGFFQGISQNYLTRLNSDGSIASGATTITGTQQIGSLAVVTATTVNYSTSTNGGVTFWMGPDEDLGYVIGVPVPLGNQTTPIVGVNAFLGFYRSILKTESSFVSLVNGTFNQSLTTGASAKTYLTNNGYWTSYV